MNTPIPAIKIEKRQKLIEQGKLWQVYPEGDSDNILFEGSRTACMKHIRQNCPNAWRKNEVRLGKVIWEAPQSAALNPADITPGDWVQGKRTDTKEWTQIFANNKIVAEVQPINKRGNRQQGDFDKEDANVKAICTAVNSTYKKGLNPEAFEEVVKLLTDSLPHLKELMEWWDRESESFEDNEKQMCKNIAGDIREFIHRSKSALQKAKL